MTINVIEREAEVSDLDDPPPLPPPLTKLTWTATT